MSAFDRVIGYRSEKNRLIQVVDMLKNRDLYKKMGAKLPKGILIYGDPGMGKTMLANAFIEESGVKSFSIRKNKGKENMIKEIEKTFINASKEEVSIVFIDDIDKFSDKKCEDVDDEAFVAIQSGIDSVKMSDVLVVATANNFHKLPKSLIRKGRFDIEMQLESPSEDDAKKIIAHYLQDKPVSKELDYNDVYHLLGYSSCAYLQSVLNESAIYSASKRKECIDIEDILMACKSEEEVDMDENQRRSKEDMDRIAIHEAGHACIAEVLKKGSVGFIKVNLNKQNIQGGYTNAEGMTRRPEVVLLDLGGKAATELFYEGRCGSGCQSDLSDALDVLTSGISDNGICGMSLLGGDTISNTLRFAQQSVARAELERYFFLAKDILMKNKEFFTKIYEQLVEKTYLLYSDVQRIRDSVKITEFYI